MSKAYRERVADDIRTPRFSADSQVTRVFLAVAGEKFMSYEQVLNLLCAASHPAGVRPFPSAPTAHLGGQTETLECGLLALENAHVIILYGAPLRQGNSIVRAGPEGAFAPTLSPGGTGIVRKQHSPAPSPAVRARKGSQMRSGGKARPRLTGGHGRRGDRGPWGQGNQAQNHYTNRELAQGAGVSHGGAPGRVSRLGEVGRGRGALLHRVHMEHQA